MSESIVVVGAGTMGAGIALVAARAGYTVELVEPDASTRERALARLAKDAAGSRVTLYEAIPERSDAAIAIEAVPERFDLKREVFKRLASALPPDALLATNTSSLAVADLADTVDAPYRVLGLHFFNPPTRMELVEIVVLPALSDDALHRARAFVERIGKRAVETSDTPGFIVNRVARPFYLQSMLALERTVASIVELDALARAAGFKMGPFELMDVIGLDVNLATSESIYDRLEAERLQPVEMQRGMVAAGRLGRKSGVGFYDYASGEIERLDLRVEASNERNDDEYVVVIGYGGVADELATMFEERYANVQRIESDEMLDELSSDATIIIDIGDGESDRRETIVMLDERFGAETVLFTDAYATELGACASALQHPERLVGFGILGALASQDAVEIVDGDAVGDDALALAQELFESIGKGVVLVADTPGLFLGRVVGSIVNEAVIAVRAEVATPEDIDLAMQLGTNYPAGPIAWGREISGRRISRILRRLADDEGEQFAPHRSLGALDIEEPPTQSEEAQLDRELLT